MKNSKNSIIDSYKKKIEELKNHNFHYYNRDDPKITDAEYDKLKKEIHTLEKKFNH